METAAGFRVQGIVTKRGLLLLAGFIALPLYLTVLFSSDYLPHMVASKK